MRRLIFFLLSLSIVFILFSASISGNVTRTSDIIPFPIPAADVVIQLTMVGSPIPPPPITTTTDMMGNYEFTDIAAGSFEVAPASETSSPSHYEVEITDPSSALDGYDFEIITSATESGFVGGKVQYADDSPVIGANVTITLPDSPFPLPTFVTTDSSGRYFSSVDGDQAVQITCIGMPPYVASPEMYEFYLAIGDSSMDNNFTMISEDPGVYQLMITGTLDGSPTDFTAEYKHIDESDWHSVSVPEGTIPVEVPDTGSYQVRAEKAGCSVAPELAEVTVSTMIPGMARFEFTDTTSSSDYEIMVTVTENDFLPSYEAAIEYHEIGVSTWYRVTTDYFGRASVFPSGPGTYELRASKPGFSICEPVMDTVTLTETVPYDSIAFNLTDSSAIIDYHVVCITRNREGEVFADQTIHWVNNSDASDAGTIVTDSEGYAIAEFEEGINARFTPYCELGRSSSPEYENVNLSFFNPSDTLEFIITDESMYPYRVIVSGYDTDDDLATDYTIEYSLPSSADWYSLESDDDGFTDILIAEEGRIDVRTSKEGWTTTPSVYTADISELTPVDSVEFLFDDGDTMEYEVVVISRNPDGSVYPNLEVYWEQSFTTNSDTITTGDEGIKKVGFTGLGNFVFEALPGDGYFTIPETENIILGVWTRVDTVIFEVHEGEPGSYVVTVSAVYEDETLADSYIIQHRVRGDSSWSYGYSDGSGYTDFEYDEPGAWEFTALKIGYETEPEIIEVNLTSDFMTDSIQFTFIADTASSNYHLTIHSMNPDSSAYSGLDVNWFVSGDSSTFGTITTGADGYYTQSFTESELYMLYPDPPTDRYCTPSEASSWLSLLNPSDTVNFIVNEGTPPDEYSCVVYATDTAGTEYPFVEFGIVGEEETATTAIGGYGRFILDSPGTYTFFARLESAIPGVEFTCTPDTFEIIVSALGMSDTVHVIINMTDGISESITPDEFTIGVYPNPFNGMCKFDSPEGTKISIFDVYGNLIEYLGETRQWNPSNENSGVYLIKFEFEGSTEIRKAIYMK